MLDAPEPDEKFWRGIHNAAPIAVLLWIAISCLVYVYLF
jgi:hypothetical protein